MCGTQKNSSLIRKARLHMAWPGKTLKTWHGTPQSSIDKLQQPEQSQGTAHGMPCPQAVTNTQLTSVVALVHPIGKGAREQP
jgi:hypothetical protein